MSNLNLSKINTSAILSARKVFFIGIGGIGISALAKMAKSYGMEIGGVNDEESPKTLDPLIEFGAKIILKKDYKELPEADLYVYSDAWPFRGPEIIQDARNTGKLVLSYYEVLGIFSKNYEKIIAISGTHGKTTTTAMTGEILIDGGLNPTIEVGSFVKSFNSNYRDGGKEFLVIEADEFNRHFLNFYPYITVIMNMEVDHLETYTDINDIKKAFSQLINQTNKYVIYNGDDQNTLDLINKYKGPVKFVNYKEFLSKLPVLSVPGEHNRFDAAAALAVANILDISEEISRKSLKKFEGTWRRLEKKGQTKNGTIIYDDYAHHPTEVRASLQALRELYPEKKLTLVFQPHLYNRTKALFNDFIKCFSEADQIILLPIYFAREKIDPTISSGKLAEEICKEGDKAIAFSDFKSAEIFLKSQIFGKDDIFVTMGAGEAYKVADNIFELY
ncbi:MAG: cyanophycin synthetase [Patescibacteria group bacterium]